MKKNRTRSKSSSWLCFHIDCKKIPADFDSEPTRSIDAVNKILVNQEKNMPMSIEKNWFRQKMKISSSSSYSEKEITRTRSTSCHTLSKIVKAVFFETTMTKNKKIKHGQYRDLKSSKKEDGLDSKICAKEVLSTSSSSSSSSSSSILSSCSSSSNLYSLSEKKKSFGSNSLEQKQIVLEESKQRKTNNNNNNISSKNGLYLLLISLMVLIFWGRICSIICTSTWIYFGRSNYENEEDKEDEQNNIVLKPAEKEMESREYKKRVIMEGLLERSHSRF